MFRVKKVYLIYFNIPKVNFLSVLFNKGPLAICNIYFDLLLNIKLFFVARFCSGQTDTERLKILGRKY